MGKIKDLRGRTFGRLTVPKDAKPQSRDGHMYWPVVCECGTMKQVRGSKLLDRSTVSCGCQRADPYVRRAVRRGPDADHLDDELEALRPYFEPADMDGPPPLDYEPWDRGQTAEPKGIDQPVLIAPDPVYIEDDCAKGVDLPVDIAPDQLGIDDFDGID